MKLYVSNLADSATESDLEKLFSAYGKVRSVSIARERHSGESRGFGFVEMSTRSEGLAAIGGLAGAELFGKRFTTNEARPQPHDRRRGGRFGR